MGAGAYLGQSAPALAVIVFFVGAIVAVAVTLVWGAAQWAQKPQHRLGERWGDEPAEVVEWSGAEGYVRAGGELWRAMSKDPLAPGDAVRVARVSGLTLEVRKDASR